MPNIKTNTSELQRLLTVINNVKIYNSDKTKDVTATNSDILLGKTAYASGKKLNGNIAFEYAKTIMPSSISQTAIIANKYAFENIVVAGDANLKSENIKKNINIFGINGNYEANNSSSGSTKIDEIIIRNISGIYSADNITLIRSYAFYDCSNLTFVNFPVCTSIGDHAFAWCSKLTSVNFPVCTTIGSSAFDHCSKLTSVNFPVCTSIGSYAFDRCSKLTSVNFPVCTSIGRYAFWWCSNLTSISFPVCTSIGGNAFQNCIKLTSLILGASSVASLANINAFQNTPMSVSTYTGSFGSIYVPASLVDAYKSATNWVTYKDRITAKK